MQQPSPRTIWIAENPSYYLQNLFSTTGMIFLLISMQQGFTHKLIPASPVFSSKHKIKKKAYNNLLILAPMHKYCSSVNNTNHLLKNNFMEESV